MTYMRVRSRTKKKTDLLGKKHCLYMICSGVKSYSRDEITGIYHCGYFDRAAEEINTTTTLSDVMKNTQLLSFSTRSSSSPTMT